MPRLMVPGEPDYAAFAAALEAQAKAGRAGNPAWGEDAAGRAMTATRALLATYPDVDVEGSLAVYKTANDYTLALGPSIPVWTVLAARARGGRRDETD